MNDWINTCQIRWLVLGLMMLCPACGEDTVGDSNDSAQRDAGGEKSDVSSDGSTKDGKVSDTQQPYVEPDPGCDLTGKWISVRRTVNEAKVLNFEMRQATHNWAYWEIEQSGTDAVVTRGLKCGLEVIDISEELTLAVVMVTRDVWEGLTRHVSNTGRHAEYKSSGKNRCSLSFERHYKVRGATVDYFTNPDIPLEEAATKAKGTTPGWEDWDEDGRPGVTFIISGIASGNLMVVQREWSEYTGTTDKNAESFKLANTWHHEQYVLEADSPLLATESQPSTDPADQFIIFTRVDNLEAWDLPEDAKDLAVCEKMRELKDVLINDPLIEADQASK